MSVLLLVVGLVLFIGLVVAHEFGHFIVARRNGVEVEEFGIFFPPRLFKRTTKAGWVFSVNLLPLGGFVKLKGEHDSDTEPGTFGAASVWAKSKIMAAGVGMNLAVALVLFMLLALIGMPKLVPNQFTVKSDTHVTQHSTTSVDLSQIEPNSPAARAGLRPSDQVTAIGTPGHLANLASATSLQAFTKNHGGQTIQIRYQRAGHSHTATATLNTTATITASAHSSRPKGYLGVGLEEVTSGVTLQRSTWSAPIVAVGLAKQLTFLTFKGLGTAIGGLGSYLAGVSTHDHAAAQNGLSSASSQVGGPVAIFAILKDGSALGWNFILIIIGYISLVLAIMNILPIPALDGGRLWITLIARAVRRPLSSHTEEVINAVGFVFIIFLAILVTFNDIHNIHRLL